MSAKKKSKPAKKAVARKAVAKGSVKKKAKPAVKTPVRKKVTSVKVPKAAKKAKSTPRKAVKENTQQAVKATKIKRVVAPASSKLGGKQLAKLIEQTCRAISLEIMTAAFAHNGISLRTVDTIMLKHKATIVNLLVDNSVITISKAAPKTSSLSETSVYAAADRRKTVSVLKAPSVQTNISTAQ